ncbi:cytochrome c oxidase subunit 5B, mitochondrial-like [Chelonus insularis]|uniref:cytochrome c oxidase subunit 5B, mitochondrial-like n=1 Tax=Chelonus insularis TaxID=460826 RepID=UPI00158B654E|nr:cytochrome c oxidase subunit 5B, mitochondrial-like [Chelonus insularis]
MAALCRRAFSQVISRQFTTSSACMKLFDGPLPDPLEIATGLHKKELLAYKEGNMDPFDVKVAKRGEGTKENPNLVGSCFDSRIVGCICEEDSTSIVWMWLHSDTPRRCFCGHWFKLVKREPL